MKRKEIRPEHKVLMTELGKRIKKLRTDKNIGYVQMSKEIGISKNAYNTIELGNVYFNFSTLLHIANYHRVSLSNLMNDL